jgi:hypothetical protein
MAYSYCTALRAQQSSEVVLISVSCGESGPHSNVSTGRHHGAAYGPRLPAATITLSSGQGRYFRVVATELHALVNLGRAGIPSAAQKGRVDHQL